MRWTPDRTLATRRQVLRSGAALAAAAGAAGLAGVASAAPQRNDPVIEMTVAVADQGAGQLQTEWLALVQDYVDRNWVPRHPGVRVTIVSGADSDGPTVEGPQVVAASLAGQATATVTGTNAYIPLYFAANLLVPIDAFVKEDHVDLRLFSPGHLAGLTENGRLMALPQFDGPMVLVYNQGLLDQLGLRYPEPDWDYTQAAALWHSCSRLVHGQRVPGCAVDLGGSNWVSHGWGATQGNAEGTASLLDSPANVAAWTWWADLVKAQVVSNNFQDDLSQVLQGIAFYHQGGWDVQSCAMQLLSLKWDFFPMPRFPAGQPATYGNLDLNGINAYSKVPVELSWSMLKFITLDPGYQRFLFRTELVTPSRLDLWGDWEEIVRAVAPPLRDKSLHYYHDAVEYAWGRYYFKYDAVQADNVKNQWLNKILAGQVSAAFGLRQATLQIDALEAAGRQSASAQTATLAEFRGLLQRAQASSQPIATPSPSRAGAGAPATAATTLVRVANGKVILTAAGAGGVDGRTDNCVFAGAAYAKSAGSFACRLVAVTPTAGAAIQDGAKIGLMARESLGSDAASVAVEFAVGHGLHSHVRSVDETGLSDNHAGDSPGLLQPQAVQANSQAPGRNLLLRPVWLRLDFKASRWVAYTSTDGRTWLPADGQFGPMPVEFLGCWIGVYATSHTSGGRVVATFDNLSGFSPDTFVQIGSA